MKYLSLLFLFVCFNSFSQKLSPEARVSLLTISPGSELYSTFGHSAIRISDPLQNIELNYNYGTFNFNDPNFYTKFLRGYLNYLISSYNSYVEMEYWNREGRLITEQVLNLSPEQKDKIFAFLENNLRPENREYRYKFFTDNCSTRLRDVLQVACGDSLVFNKTLNPDSTYRQWIDKYAHKNNQEWADFGMDLALGTGADQKTGWADAMFIPDNLMTALDEAYIITPAGKEKLVLAKHNLNQIATQTEKTSITPIAFWVIAMVLVAIYSCYQMYSKKRSILFDKIFFSVLGISGWILTMLWFLTDHGVTRYNLNMLWAFPLLFPAILFLGRKSWASYLMFVYAALLVVDFLVVQFATSYGFSTEVIFIVLIIFIRLGFLFKSKYIGLTSSKNTLN